MPALSVIAIGVVLPLRLPTVSSTYTCIIMCCVSALELCTGHDAWLTGLWTLLISRCGACSVHVCEGQIMIERAIILAKTA